MDKNYDDQGQGFLNLLRTLRTRWVVVALPLVLVPAFAGAYSLAQDERYTASATVLIRDTPGSDLKLSAVDEERAAATNLGLASLARLADRTAEQIGPSVTAGTVARNVTVKSESTSNLFTITSESATPKLAAEIANTYAREFVVFRRTSDVRTVRDAQRRAQNRALTVQRRLTRLRNESEAPPGTVERASQDNERRQLRLSRDNLLQEAQELSTLAALTSGNVEVTQRAGEPGAPTSPKPLRNTLFGLGIGLLVGIGLALLFELLDRRIKDPDEVERIMRTPLLGAIPLSSALARRSKRWPFRKPKDIGAGEKEAFHMLRANLRYLNPENPPSSVLVTSATPGDGKSTVAWNLAAAGANAGNRTILVEAELRRPVFVREFNLPASKGLSEILTQGIEAQSVVHRFRDTTRDNGAGHASMDVIVAGRTPPNPVDLLQSQRMLDLIAELESEYDLVVIDTPPVAVVSDAIPLLSHVGGVIVVTRLGQTTRDAAEHLRKQLDDLNAHTLGVVINGVTTADGYYGDTYGYADQYQTASPARSAT